MRLGALLAVVFLSSGLWPLPRALADSSFYRPTPGNQYVTTTDKYLYVVWSVPRNLAPFSDLTTREQLEAFVARTALHLCKAHRAKEPTGTKGCKVQVIRMNSNDEYTKSAAGGFKTIATLVAPLSKLTDDLVARASGLSLGELKPLFSKFSFVHEEISLGSAR
jgi:hypothetical protein